MSLGRGQLDAIVHALTIVLPARAPADTQLRQFFRDNKNLGPRDRELIADTVYAALRRRRLLEKVTPHATPRVVVFDYGEVIIRGVGESWEPIFTIGSPLKFRNHITAR